MTAIGQTACRFIITTALVGYGLAAESPLIDKPWQRLSDGTISVYTQTDSVQAASILRSFADLRSALVQTSIFKVNETVALKVIAFNSDKDFNQYRLNSTSCAFYQETSRSDYIVLQDLSPGYREVSAHEFTHFVIAHSGVNLPLWLNEGLADFYSTYQQISTDRVKFGAPVSGRLSILQDQPWLPLENLFQFATTASFNADPGRMLMFYSESWALTHMLMVSTAYAPHFADFVRALDEGHSGADSALLAYGKTPRQMSSELAAYLASPQLPFIEAQIRSRPMNLRSTLSNVSNAEMDVTLSDLIPNNSTTQATLERRLVSAAIQLPDSAEAEESLGYLALRQGKDTQARMHFQLAVDRHSNDANVFFYLAHLNREAGVSADQVLALLSSALALNPDLNDARLELALAAAEDSKFEIAIQAFQKLATPRPENAYAAAYMEAYCYAHLNRFSEAQAAARRATSLAKGNRDRAQVSELIDFISHQSLTP